MGLKLIHSDEKRDQKPQVYVVAEENIYDALSKDLALDVYPVCFSYASFVQAFVTKSISTNNAIVLVSDSLSQKMAPLEAVIALVRENIVLIPWQQDEQKLKELNVKSSIRRPTLNTLRRSLYNHIGLIEPPARYDGDVNLDVPESALIIENNTFFSINTQNQDTQKKENAINRLQTIQGKIASHKGIGDLQDSKDQSLQTSNIDSYQASFSEPVVQTPLVQTPVVQTPVVQTPVVQTPVVQTPLVQTPVVQIPLTPEIDETKLSHTDMEVYPKSPENVVVQDVASNFNQDFFKQGEQVENTKVENISNYALPAKPSFSDSSDFSNIQDTDRSDEASVSIFETKDNIADEALFAFGSHDVNGNQSMWSMYESNDDLSNAKNTLNMNDFPTVSDGKRQLTLKEPMIICVYSPKGGVGKTSISVNMAARLSYTTKAQVCIVDLDIGFGNVGTRLGLYNPTVRELLNEHHLDSESLSRNLVYDRRSGLFALLAPLRPETGANRRKFSPATYSKILELLTQRFDIVILDCPVELRDPLVSGFALTSSDKVVMVVNNEHATLLDARRALEAMCRSKDSQRLPGLGIDPSKIGLIVNQKVDNVGREVEDIKQVISGSDFDHPSNQVDLLAVIEDDRELWVGNANMARTVATSGENSVDTQLDKIWEKILPKDSMQSFDDTPGENISRSNKLDDIFSSNSEYKDDSKIKRKLFKWKKGN